MRFMMFMIPKVYQGEEGKNASTDFAPPVEAVERMTKYNEELARSGALVSAEGLHPPVDAVQVSFKHGKPIVTDGPFAESKEVVGGYWMIEVQSREEAIEWARRVPADEGDVIEIRQVFEMEDWPEDIQEAADSPVVKAQLDKHAPR